LLTRERLIFSGRHQNKEGREFKEGELTGSIEGIWSYMGDFSQNEQPYLRRQVSIVKGMQIYKGMWWTGNIGGK
jgi:hypothetical protein